MSSLSIPAPTVDLSSITKFWKAHYLDDFIAQGGSKIKFVVGRAGSGKTTLLRLASADAKASGYLTVSFSAGTIWLNDFSKIYLEVLRQCDINALVDRCVDALIMRMGYRPSDIPEGKTFWDFLSDQSEYDPLASAKMKSEISAFFLRNPYMDNNFALALSILTSQKIGYLQLDDGSLEVLRCWLFGEKVLSTQLRLLGLSPYRLTKFNARHMLRSLSELICLSGYKGLFVTVDDLEAILSTSPLDAMHYTKMKRDDTYESLRELVDDIDSFRHFFCVFASERAFIDDEKNGVMSYQALWLRLQNEIISSRFNYFADLIDLDAYEKETCTVDAIVALSKKLCEYASTCKVGSHAITREEAERLLKESQMGSMSIPLLINKATLVIEGGEHV